MPLEYAKVKYPMEQRPQIIKMNATTDINFMFSLLDQPMNDAQVEPLMKFFKKIMKASQPANVFQEEKLEEVNGLTIGWFDYISNGYDGKIFNLVYVLPIDGKLLHGVFNCAIGDSANWRAVALQVMRTIEEIRE